MTQHQALVDDYLAVWNETDPARRRRRIGALWAPGGATFNRMLEARGYDAIVERVTGANDRWVRDGGFEFRPARVSAFGEAVRLVWVMASRATGEVDSRAQSYLVLDAAGRVLCDYQFPLQAADDEPIRLGLVETYLAFWNETDPGRLAATVAGLWARGGGHADGHGVEQGHPAILAAAAQTAAAYAARGRPFRLTGAPDGHHGAVRFDWAAGEGDAALTGSGLLLLDGDGLIDRAYTFEDAKAQAQVAA
ncbi:MAG: hypothetical protein JF588_16135 [Caulobacterales bacterium]|nr:hypothetical protein [Caulobacterales bacterium]